MRTEQLKLLGNVIEFPNNQEVNNKEILDKFYVAVEFLRAIAENGHDFNITITRDAAIDVFKVNEEKLKDLLVISTSSDFEREIKYQRKSYSYIKNKF